MMILVLLVLEYCVFFVESGVPYNLTVHPVNGFGLGEKAYRLFFVEEKSNNHLLYFKLLHPCLSTCCNYYVHSLHTQCITCPNKLIFVLIIILSSYY